MTEPKQKEQITYVATSKSTSRTHIQLVQENNARIKAFVPYDKKGWIEVIRNVPGRAWNVEKKYWSLPNVKVTYRILKKEIGMSNLDVRFVINANIPDEWHPSTTAKPQQSKKNYTKLRQSQKDAVAFLIEKLTLKAYSPSTFKNYKGHLIGLLIFHNKIEPIDIQDDHVEQYLLHCIKTKKISESTQNQIINAYKAYAELVLKRSRVFTQIIRPKKPKTLPNVLSKEEVIRLIDCIDNIKHKLIILLIYSAGLRRSEAIQMRVRDVSFERSQIFIKSAKGKKDRLLYPMKTRSIALP